MATRSPKTRGKKPGDVCTEFQLHKSQIVNVDLTHIFDYTEHRLKRYIKATEDEQQVFTLRRILAEYKRGLVAIAWKSGLPVWLKVTKEAQGS